MTKISLFKSLPKKGESHLCSEVITMMDFLNGVRFGKWSSVIEPIIAEKDKARRNAMKRNIPSVTIAGVFRERKASELLEHSGFMAIDIDSFNDKTQLQSDPYTYSLFYSASQTGLVVLVKVNPDKHKESYNWISDYYFKNFGIAVDEAPKSVASLRYVSFDPDLFINERSKRAGVKSDKRPKTSESMPIVLPDNVAAEMCNEALSIGVDLAPDYASYFKLGCSLAAGFGESGRAMFHTLCSASEKYNHGQAEKKYNECLRVYPKSGVSVGTFYWMLKQHGIHPPKESQKPVKLAVLGKQSGRTREGITQQLVQMEGMEQSEAAKIVDEVMKRDDMSLRVISTDPEDLIQNTVQFIQQNHPIRKNVITGMLEETGTEVKRERLNSIYLRARSVFNSKEVSYDLIERIIFSEFTPEFNPINEYIEANLHRNKHGQIDALVNTITTDSDGADVFIRKWVLSWIAAIQGYPVRSVLCLTGGQNSGKTEWFRRLPPNNLRKYYAESKLDAGKDDDILMCQKLWVMDDEMGGKSKQDEKRFKELTSKSMFSLRAPYGRHNEDFKRLAVLGGTSNDDSVINDPTGNTRILPIRVIEIDHNAYNAIDKDELFMEAYRAYHDGEQWQLNKEEMAMLDGVGVDFETIPFERELILRFFEKPKAGRYSDWLSATEIKDVIETNTRQKIMSPQKLGIELRNIFGMSKSKKVDGVPLKKYEVVRLLQDTPNATGYTGLGMEDEPPF
jgi:predicted P-loop ATPase